MSALDDFLGNTKQRSGYMRERAVNELAQIRADLSVAQIESSGRLDSLNNWYSLWEYIIKQLGGDSDLLPSESSFDAMMSRVITLHPRRCNRDCYVRGFEAGREAAAKIASGEWRLKQYDGDYQYIRIDCVADMIRSIDVPPDACDGCNPLAPSAE